MEKLRVKKSSVIAILLIAIFVTSVFSMPGLSSAALFNRYETVKIGVISPIDDFLGIFTDLYKNVVEHDINAYVAKLPVSRFTQPVKFEFQVVSAGTGTADEHFAQIKNFHKMGVDLIIGGWFSSQIDDRTLAYLKTNKMVMISPTSNAPSLAKVDNLFRLLPDASTEGTIVAAMFAKLGLTNAIVVYRDDAWGNGVYNSFTSSFSGAVSWYKYTPDDKTSFKNALTDANSGAGGGSEGVFLISIDSDCVDQINDERTNFVSAFPKLASIPWFGADGTAFSNLLKSDNVGALKILSPNPATPHNTKFDGMKSRYLNAIGADMDYSGACMIDAGWILAQAVIETRSTTFLKSPGATDVIKVLSDDCSRYFGYSGWCLLDQNGDRVSSDWEIWGYGLSGDNLVTLEYGTYNYGTISWIVVPTW